MRNPGSGFQPPWWATTGTLLVGALFMTLGSWQLSRAAEKRAFLATFDAGVSSAPMPPPMAGTDLDAVRYRAVRVTGQFDAAHQVLLDARTREGRAGYEVLTPLTRDGNAILVNRGWVPANPDRTRLPDIAVGGEPRTVTGILDRLPRAALASGPGRADAAAAWPRVLLYPTAAEIAAATAYPVEDYQLLLAPGESDGFAREWRPAVMTPEQHLGYAVQWFALAVALVVLYVVLNWRKAAAAPKNP